MHRVVRKRHVRREDDDTVVYEPGDTFEPTDTELDAFGDKLEPVDEAVNPRGSTADPDLQLDELTVDQIRDALETGDYDDRLDELAEQESNGQDRKGVYEELERRR